MKKNKMMRLASALLVAVLLTTCTISGTYAKYVTTNNASDTAQVAKWGVKIEPNGSMFAKEYVAGEDNRFEYDGEKSVVGRSGLSVDGNTDSNRVAPGTNGTLAQVDLTGRPEVAFNVTYVADLTLTNWSVKGNDYCPMVFVVDGKSYGMYLPEGEKNVICNSVSELEEKVEAAIADYSENFDPNTNLEEIDDLEVSWYWLYETPNSEGGNYDVEDTALGDAEIPATVTLEITTTVTQID